MATIALNAANMNQMSELLTDLQGVVKDFKSQLASIGKKTLTINSSVCNIEDIISSIQVSTQTQEQKIDSIDTLAQRIEEFTEEVVKIDGRAAEVVRKREDDFYKTYSFLKPEGEKSWLEKVGDWFVSAADWCAESWEKVLDFVGKIIEPIMPILSAIFSFVHGFVVSIILTLEEIPLILLGPIMLIDNWLFGGILRGEQAFFDYMGNLEKFYSDQVWYADNKTAFYAGKTIGDIVTLLIGVAGMTGKAGKAVSVAIKSTEGGALALSLVGGEVLVVAVESVGGAVVAGKVIEYGTGLGTYKGDIFNKKISLENIEGGTNSLYDDNGNYTGGRSQAELDELANDPAHSGSTRQADIDKGLHEREVGLGLEESGKVKGPITRDPSGKAEFIDANGQAWDVKSFNSNYKPSKGGYTLTDAMNKIYDSLAENENVMLDTSNLNVNDLAELMKEIIEKGLEDKVIVWP